MKTNEELLRILKDLIDDQNIVLYALIVLAIIYPSEAKMIIAAMIGYWKGKEDKR